jgi:hypothetical protein
MNASGRTPRGLTWWSSSLAALAALALALAFAFSEGKAQPPGLVEARTAQGRVQSLTSAPMGEIDGAVLDDGTVIHWPPHLADRFSAVATRGDRIRAVGWMETGPAGDTHLEIQTVTNLRTNDSRENDALPPCPGPRRRPRPPPPGPRQANATTATASQTALGKV